MTGGEPTVRAVGLSLAVAVVAHDSGTGADDGPLDWCRLLTCWLKNRSVVRLLKQHGIDSGELIRCVDATCRNR